jgi:hypothetical protein
VDRERIKRDTSYSGVDNKMKFDIRIQGDSAFQHWTYCDTLLDISRGDILRKYKGHYFLNDQISAGSWRVTLLTKIDNGVTLGSVSKKEDIGHLRELTATKSDSVFIFRPTRKEMRQYLKEKGFSENNTYVKVQYVNAK